MVRGSIKGVEGWIYNMQYTLHRERNIFLFLIDGKYDERKKEKRGEETKEEKIIQRKK